MNTIHVGRSLLLIMAMGMQLFAGAILSHPDKIAYDSLKWQVPDGGHCRTMLKNGLRLYSAEDKALPLVKVVGYIRYGSVCDAVGKEGLGQLTALCMRTGGIRTMSADSLDALLDRMAIKLSISCTPTEFTFKCSFLSDYTDTALALLSHILFEPTFNADKIKSSKELMTESVRNRFNTPGPIVDAAFDKQLYPKQLNSRLATEKSIKNLTRTDCMALHKQFVTTGNMVVAVSGAFDRVAMEQRFTILFKAAVDTTLQWPFPAITATPLHKAIFIQRSGPQTNVRFGLPLFKRPNNDYYAVSVLNLILGGGGFTSRLGTKIRSDEGLTYSIHSEAESNYIFPGALFIQFHTKNETVTLATTLSLIEIDKLKTGGITADELARAKRMLIDGLPSMFRSSDDIVETYAWNEYYGRPATIFKEYPAAVKALTVSDITAAAKKYLNPEQFIFTVVGDSSAVSTDSAKAFWNTYKPYHVLSADSLSALP